MKLIFKNSGFNLISQKNRMNISGFVFVFVVFILLILPFSSVTATPSGVVPYNSRYGTIEYIQQTYYPNWTTIKLRKKWNKFHFKAAGRLYGKLEENGKDTFPFTVSWKAETSPQFYRRLLNKLFDSSEIKKILRINPEYGDLRNLLANDPITLWLEKNNGVQIKKIYDGQTLEVTLSNWKNQCTFKKHIITYNDLPVNFTVSSDGSKVAYQVRKRVSIINLGNCHQIENYWMEIHSSGASDVAYYKYIGKYIPMDIKWVQNRYLFILYDQSARVHWKSLFYDSDENRWYLNPQLDFDKFRRFKKINIGSDSRVKLWSQNGAKKQFKLQKSFQPEQISKKQIVELQHRKNEVLKKRKQLLNEPQNPRYRTELVKALGKLPSPYNQARVEDEQENIFLDGFLLDLSDTKDTRLMRAVIDLGFANKIFTKDKELFKRAMRRFPLTEWAIHRRLSKIKFKHNKTDTEVLNLIDEARKYLRRYNKKKERPDMKKQVFLDFMEGKYRRCLGEVEKSIHLLKGALDKFDSGSLYGKINWRLKIRRSEVRSELNKSLCCAGHEKSVEKYKINVYKRLLGEDTSTWPKKLRNKIQNPCD